MRHLHSTCSDTISPCSTSLRPDPSGQQDDRQARWRPLPFDIELSRSWGAAATSKRAVVEVSIDSGPHCTGCIPLAAGRYVVGRSSAAHLRIADPQLGLHHAVIDVDEGAVMVTQLSGQAPLRLDGEAVTGTRSIRLPARLSIGMNDLWIAIPRLVADCGGGPDWTSAGKVVALPNDPWRHVVQRGPDRPMEPERDPITPPNAVEVLRTPPATALIGAAVAVLGAGAIVVLLGQMMVALLASFGAVASAATWLVGAAPTWRDNRRSRRAGVIERQRFLDDLAAARIAARQRHLIVHADLGRIIAIADALAGPVPLPSDVWTRRLADGGAGGPGDSRDDDRDGRATFYPVIGTGTSRWTPTIEGEVGPDSVTDIDCVATINDVPIPLGLTCGEVVAISGGPTERHALLRSIVCQLAVRHGPADWQLVVVSADRQKWGWADWLPHCRFAAGTLLIADRSDADQFATAISPADGPAPRPTVLIVDDPTLLAVRTSVLRRFVARVQPATLTTIETGAPTPALCHAVVEVGSTGAVITTRLDGSAGGVADTASSISMCGLSMERSASIARSLAKLVDPEY
jgi:S-DNA-T family DNA segregation ATPase FtsK/SpoIIIE